MKIEIQSLKLDQGNLIVCPSPNSKHLLYQLISDYTKSGKPYEADIDVIKKKRSLNSNSYAWLLIGKMADLLRRSKEEIYLDMLKIYGQSQAISVVSDGAEMLTRTVKYYEEFGETVLNNRLFKHFKVYVGSSEFNTAEMSIFISGIVDEAKCLDIEVLTPEQLSLMNGAWEK